ncbi:MAG: MATE family efflux transporter [Lachnospiraceae bacterium]|nr:MATE family efflux transporter [Lachnospiraceae bacterium]
MEEDIKLSQDFTVLSLLKYVMPSILAFVFMGIYQAVDGIFIDKNCGEIAVAAVNLQVPMNCIYIGLGNMIGLGGDAVLSKKLGEGDREGANATFTRCIRLALILSVICLVFSLIFKEPIMHFLGASDVNIVYLRPYYTILAAFAPAMLLQSMLNVFFMTESRNTMGAILMFVGGILNIVLDWLFMFVFGMGIEGAAIATGISYFIALPVAFWFYGPSKRSLFRLIKCKNHPKETFLLCFNGSSEMFAELSIGITTLMMNRIIASFLGENGVSALAVLAYFQIFVLYLFAGYCAAIEPIFGYHYGSKDTVKMKKNFKLALLLTAIFTVFCFALIFFLKVPAISLFFEPGDAIFNISMEGYLLFLAGTLLVGFNMFASALFTALSNGVISVTVSILRCLVFLGLALLILPKVFGLTGFWISWPVAEAATLIVSIILVLVYRKRYGYLCTPNPVPNGSLPRRPCSFGDMANPKGSSSLWHDPNSHILRLATGLEQDRPGTDAARYDEIRIPSSLIPVGCIICADPFPDLCDRDQLSAVRMPGKHEVYACCRLRIIIIRLMIDHDRVTVLWNLIHQGFDLIAGADFISAGRPSGRCICPADQRIFPIQVIRGIF